MKRIILSLAAICLAGAVHAQGDPVISSVQQKLKDQGFYYGNITGSKDADTTAAIRRYQIRNGLQITGELNAETQKSLGVKGASSAPAATPSRAATPRPVAPAAPTPPPRIEPDDTSDLRDDSPAVIDPRGGGDPSLSADAPEPGYAPGPRGLAPDLTGALDGTPFEVAPPDVQRRVIVGAQTLLMRAGFYRSGIDGVYGPGTAMAIRAYQSEAELEPTGRLDLETLGSLGLLPGQQSRESRPRRRIWREPVMRSPEGERIYIPR